MNHHTTSSKSPLMFTGVLLLGLFASSGFGQLLGALTPEAQAYPGNGNGYGKKACNQSSMEGKFGITFQGTIAGVGEIVGVGQEVCDHHGDCTGSITFNLAGTVGTDNLTSEGTVNPDCTGTSTVHYESGLVATSAFTIVADGDEIHFIGTDPGTILKGVQRRR